MLKPMRILLTRLAFGLFLFISLSLCIDLSSAKTPTQSKDNCDQIIIQADDLYIAGKKSEARELYRQCKQDFLDSSSTTQSIPEPVYDVKELAGGQKLWANVLDGLELNLDSKIYFSLITLTKNYPNFIPAHLKLVDFCLQKPDFCSNSAKKGQPSTASQVMEMVTELYPDNPDLVRKKIELYLNEKKFLEASITARQFAIVYNDYPEANEFSKKADEYLEKFQTEMNNQLIGQTVAGSLAGVAAGVLNNNIYQGLSGLQMISLMLKGESGFGKEASLALSTQYKKEDKILDDVDVLNYVKGIAGRMTPFMGRDFEYEYYVIKNDELNAFALPGGKVFVNTGAILKTSSEAELAGLLGHEISHSILSHGFLKTAQTNFLESLTIVAPFIQKISPIVNAQYSQSFERQADILGTRVLSLSGYTSDGLRNLMIKLGKEKGNETTTYLSTHPAPSERVKYLEKIIQDNRYDRYVYEGVKKHQEIQSKIKG